MSAYTPTANDQLFVTPYNSVTGTLAPILQPVTAGSIAALQGAGSYTDAITASGTTQGTATAITSDVNRVSTAANATAPYSSIVLPVQSAGNQTIVYNDTANPIQVFPPTGFSINDGAANASMSQMPNSLAMYEYDGPSEIHCINTASGYSALSTGGVSLNTVFSVDGLTASATQTQAGGTVIIASQNRFTTVATTGNAATLPPALSGLNITVINAGANPMQIFPATGGFINGQAVNTSLFLPAGAVATFISTLALYWHTQITYNIPQLDQYQVNSGASSMTLTAANLAGGTNVGIPAMVDLALTGTPSTAQTLTLPTPASLVAVIPNVIAGQTYRLRILNIGGTSSGVWTVGATSGWTLNGTMTIDVGGFRDFQVQVTSLSAIVLQSVGSGTI